MVNDGSSDGTLSLIQDFAGRDRRVVVIDQENQGVCKARNNGLKVARGEFVFFLDGDDYLTDDASSVIFDFCQEASPDITLFGNYKVYERTPASEDVWFDSCRDIPLGIYNTETYVEKANKIPVSFKVYRTEFLKAQNITFEESLITGEMYTFFVHALTRSKTIGVSAGYIMYYLKRSESSATTVINIVRDKSIVDTLHTLFAYASNYPGLLNRRSFVVPFFWLITAFSLIKYVGRTKYTREIGGFLSQLKNEKEYKHLIDFLTRDKGMRFDKYSLIAAMIKFLPIKTVYVVLRMSYLIVAHKR